MNKKHNDTSKISNLLPIQPCHKCGKTLWNFTSEKCVWSCTCCGNLIYYAFGVLDQQIDRVMLSSDRSMEFVYTEDERCIKPKKNDDLKMLRHKGIIK